MGFRMMVHPFVRGVTRRLLDRRVTLNSVVSFNTGDMTKGLVVELAGFMKALEGQARDPSRAPLSNLVSVHDIARGEDGEEVDDLAAELGVPRHDAKFLLETESVLGLTEDSWCRVQVRAVVRFASQDKADWRVVPPAWLAALAAANKATRFARETALKEYLRDPSLPPAVPAPAQIPADGDSSLGDALGALVDEASLPAILPSFAPETQTSDQP
ncbi:hypothetical protein T484DRAFT_1776012 [Baffinella frigidus]|nr:hypothetical protein T484DRAFT_1776012 [Cryptophyta sp. CCMP2293]